MKTFFTLFPQQAIKFSVLLFVAAFLIFGLAAGAEAKGVKVESADVSELTGGAYTIYTYGCNATEDAPAVAILKKEGTPYDFSMDTAVIPEYRTATGIAAGNAYRFAEEFVKCNPEVDQVALNKIMAPDGAVLGYEVLPIYPPLRYGTAGLVGTSYRIDGNRLLADVTVNPIADMDWGA